MSGWDHGASSQIPCLPRGVLECLLALTVQWETSTSVEPLEFAILLQASPSKANPLVGF